MKTWEKVAIGAVVVASFTLPLFRSGGRTGLTFWGWVVNHTIFGPPVEYVPEEDYMSELEGLPVTGISKESDIAQVTAFYQISEESARRLISH